MVNALLAEHPENDVCTWGKNILKMKQHRYTVAHRGTDSMGTLKSEELPQYDDNNYQTPSRVDLSSKTVSRAVANYSKDQCLVFPH